MSTTVSFYSKQTGTQKLCPKTIWNVLKSQ